jgi:hypothetical protein
MDTKTIELAKEARRQFENCLYTGASLYEWLKFLRLWNMMLSVLPLIFGSLATWKILDANENKLTIGVFALLAGLLPVVHRALKLDAKIAEVNKAAGEFTNLRDRFRQIATVSVHKPWDEFLRDFDAAMARMEKARQLGITASDFFMYLARHKIKKGTYDSDFEASVPAFKHLDQQAPVQSMTSTPPVVQAD